MTTIKIDPSSVYCPLGSARGITVKLSECIYMGNATVVRLRCPLIKWILEYTIVVAVCIAAQHWSEPNEEGAT